MDAKIPIYHTKPALRGYILKESNCTDITVHRGENSYIELTIQSPKCVLMKFTFEANCEILVTIESLEYRGEYPVAEKVLWINMPRVADINWGDFVMEKKANFPCEIVILSASGNSVAEAEARVLLKTIGMHDIRGKTKLNNDQGYWLVGCTRTAAMAWSDQTNETAAEILFLGSVLV